MREPYADIIRSDGGEIYTETEVKNIVIERIDSILLCKNIAGETIIEK